MKNIDVVKAFLLRAAATGSNLISSGDKLFSYHTCIAQFLPTGRLIINITKYSPTTSKHQGYLERSLNGFHLLNVRYIDNIYRGSSNLDNYNEEQYKDQKISKGIK